MPESGRTAIIPTAAAGAGTDALSLSPSLSLSSGDGRFAGGLGFEVHPLLSVLVYHYLRAQTY